LSGITGGKLPLPCRESPVSYPYSAAGAEPALPIVESSVSYLYFAVAGGLPPALGLLLYDMTLFHAMNLHSTFIMNDALN